jgi:uncharacterized protein
MHTNLSAKPRIEIVDALRGFALFGIILAHFNNQYFAGFPPPGHEAMGIKNAADSILQGITDIFIFGKFFTIFSFLFGLSFGIQLLNAKERNKPFLGRFAWRLVILFLIAFLHHIHYRGDILIIYAVLGFFLLLYFKASNKWLLIWAFFFILNGPSAIFNTVNYISSLSKPAVATAAQAPEGIDFKQMGADAAIYYNKAKEGAYVWIIKNNITKEFQNKLAFQLFSGRLFVTMGLFILGFYMARRRIFENVAAYKKGFKKWMWISLALSVAAVASYGLLNLQFGSAPQTLPQLLGTMVVNIYDPALSTVYVACFVLLFQNVKWQRRLSALVPMGRMGLTTYLTQTVFGLLLFYGYGLNKLGEIGNSVIFPIAIAFFILQVYIGKWWMKRFYYGPVEWLWRALTWFTIPPFIKRKKPENVLAAATV